MARCCNTLILCVVVLLSPVCLFTEALVPSIRMVSPPHLYSELTSTVVLHCAYNASDSAVIITWSHNNSVVASNHFTVRTTEVHTELTLQQLSWKDSGLYACSVTGRTGRSTAITRLEVVSREVDLSVGAVGETAGDQPALVIPDPDLDVLTHNNRERHQKDHPFWTGYRGTDVAARPPAGPANQKGKGEGVHKAAWFIVTLCIALVVCSAIAIMLCAARRRARARRIAKANKALKAQEEGEEGLKEESQVAPATNGDSTLQAASDVEAKAKKYGFDYSKPQAVQTLSHSPQNSPRQSFRAAKSESTIPQLLTQKKERSSSVTPSPTEKPAESFMLTTSLSDVAALSKDAARKSKHRNKPAQNGEAADLQHSPLASAAQRSASVSDIKDTSETNLTEPHSKQSSRLRLTISEMTKGAFKSLRKPHKDSKGAKKLNDETSTRTRSKTTSSIAQPPKKLIPAEPSKVEGATMSEKQDMPASEDPEENELKEIAEAQTLHGMGALKLSKSLECLEMRDDSELARIGRRSGSLTPPPTGCAPLGLLRPKPRPRASTTVAKAKKPRVVVEYRTVSPTSWDYSNGTPPALPVIQNAAAGISTPPSTLSKTKKELPEVTLSCSGSSAGAPPLPSGRPPPPPLDRKPIPMPVPRKSRKANSSNGATSSEGDKSVSTEQLVREKQQCEAYEKVDVAALLRPGSGANSVPQTKVHKTHSAPKANHIYDKPEGRDAPANQRSRPDVALSYAISGPLDDRMQPPAKPPHMRRSAGDIQIADLDDILRSIEDNTEDLNKIAGQTLTTPGGADESPSDQLLPELPHFYDRPGHMEKQKGRDRSQSLNQRPTKAGHEPLVEYTSLEFTRKNKGDQKDVKPVGPTVYALVDPKATSADPSTKAPPRPKSPSDDYEPVEAPRLVPHSFKAQKPKEQFQAQQQQQKRFKKPVFQKSLKW
eukprot:scpid2258/ scgid1223/ 